MVFSAIMASILIIALGYGAWVIHKKKITLENLVFDNAYNTFILVGVLSTIGEVIGLAIIATQSEQRHVALFNAIFRYGLMGFLEILTSFLFTFSFVSMTNKAAKDGLVTPWEITKTILVCFPIWVLGCLVTNLIGLLYLESIGHRELVIHGGLAPWNFASFEVVPYESMIVYTQPELAAMVMIYITPFINIFLVVFYIMRTYKKLKEESLSALTKAEKKAAEKEKKESESHEEDEKTKEKEPETEEEKKADETVDEKTNTSTKNDTKNEDEAVSVLPDDKITSFAQLLRVVELVHSSFDHKNFVRFMYRLCGVDPDEPSKYKVTEDTSEKVKEYIEWVEGGEVGSAKGVSPVQHLSKEMSILIGQTVEDGGRANVGLKAINYFNKEFLKHSSQLKSISEECYKLVRQKALHQTTHSTAFAEASKKLEEELERITDPRKKTEAKELVSKITDFSGKVAQEVKAFTESIDTINYNSSVKY